VKIEPGVGSGGEPGDGPGGRPGGAGNDGVPGGARTPQGNRRLDVALVLKQSLEAIGRNLSGVLVAGLALVVAPGMLAGVLVAGGDWGTLAMVIRGVCAMLYVALVSWGTVAWERGRALPAWQRGRALPAWSFVAEGLAQATPGLQVALLAGAAVFLGMIVHLFAQHGTLAGWALDSLLLTAALIGICVALPVVPVAVVERLGPMAAFRRAAALTEGNRNRILALALIVALALAPLAALVASVAWPAGMGRLAASLFEFVAWSLVAIVPAVAYAGLRDGSE
jgi:hypothetical protein